MSRSPISKTDPARGNPMARPPQTSTSIGFRRLWTTGLLGAWLSIFAGNAAAWCDFEGTWICHAPLVSLSSPANGATYTLPTSFPVTATVNNFDQPITQVNFFVNNTIFQTVTTAP